jgi:hypothetical protein
MLGMNYNVSTVPIRACDHVDQRLQHVPRYGPRFVRSDKRSFSDCVDHRIHV